MSIPPRLAVKFEETIGHEATEDFVTWMDGVRADLNELKQEVLRVEIRLGDRIDSKIGALQKTFDDRFGAVDEGFGALQKTIDGRFGAVDERFGALQKTFDDRFGAVGERFGTIEKAIADLRVELKDQHASLLKWSFVFWVGAVMAIATLAGVLRH